MTLNKKILTIANGELPAPFVIEKMTGWADLIVAVDGGANHCALLGINPDFIVGDMDSIAPENRSRFHNSEIIYLPDQNKHDFEKALEFLDTLHPDEVRVISAWGKRFDHILANLYITLLRQYSFKISLYDTEGVLSIIRNEIILNDAVGQTISLFSFQPVFGLCISGCKYRNVQPDYPDGFIGLSNVISENPAIIKIQKGFLLLYRLYANN